MSLNAKFLKFILFYAYQYIILYCAVRSANAFKEDDWLTIILTLPAVLVGSEFMRRDVIKINERDARADGDPPNKRELDNLEV